MLIRLCLQNDTSVFLCQSIRMMKALLAIILEFLLWSTSATPIPIVLENVDSPSLARSYYIDQTYRAYSHCVIHIVDLIGKVDLPVPSIPLIVDEWALEVFSNSSLPNYKLIRPLAQNRVKRSIEAIKIRNFHCFATFLLLQNSSSVLHRNCTYWSECPPRDALKLILKQEFTLGLKIHSIEGQRRAVLHQIFFPESVIVFCEGFDSFSHSVQKQFSTLHTKLFSDVSHIPTVVLLLWGGAYSPIHSKKLDNHGVARLLCWYCDEHHRLVGLDRAVAVDSAERKSVELRRELMWNNRGNADMFSKLSFCPFILSLRVARKQCAQEHVNLFAVALASLNSSVLKSRGGSPFIPRVIISSEWSSDEVFAAAEDWQFGLITSDGLHDAYHWADFSPLLQPLDTHVWTGIYLMIVTAAVSVTWPAYPGDGCLKKFLYSCYSISCLLLQQPHEPVMRKDVNLEPYTTQMIHRKTKTIWTLWLLSALFLVSCYSGAFNSNYVFEPAYTRNWTTSWLGLENFTIFVGFQAPVFYQNFIQLSLTDGYSVHSMICHDTFAKSWGLTYDTRRPCSFVRDYINIKSQRSGIFKDEGWKGHDAIQDSIRLVCVGQMRRAIRVGLMKPKTIYVSPLTFFDTDWEFFREEMRSDKQLRFSRHFDKDGASLLSSLFTYKFTKGLHPWHMDGVPRRLKGIVSSGILGLWRKWKNMRIKFHLYRKSPPKNLLYAYVPLSLDGSDVNLVFLLFLLCLSAASLSFMFEILFNVLQVRA